MKPSEMLWSGIKEIFDAIVRHPFIEELSKGTLSEAVFRNYVIQDALYLDEYARILALLASKAPREEWVRSFVEDSSAIIDFEKALHREYFSVWDLSPEKVRSAPQNPTNLAYVNHLWRSALLEEFPVGVAAVTPCYWIYLEVGRYLEAKGSPNELYKRWIATYSSKEYAKYVARILDIVDESLSYVNRLVWAKATKAFRLS
ncbi:MAG: thiaminase II, partial [Zestosphaera sp.]